MQKDGYHGSSSYKPGIYMLSPDWLLISQLYSEVRFASFLRESKDIKLTVCTDVMEQKGELESLVSEPLLLTTLLIEESLFTARYRHRDFFPPASPGKALQIGVVNKFTRSVHEPDQEDVSDHLSLFQ